MQKTKTLTLMAMFIAMEVVLKTYVTQLFIFDKYGLSYIPAVFSSIMLGPWLGGITGAIADVVTLAIRQDGPYFAGYTLSAFSKGAIYGLFLFKKPKNLKNITLAIIAASLLIDIGMNTVWASMFYGKSAIVILQTKVPGRMVFSIFQVISIYYLWKLVGKEVEKITLR